MIKNEVENPELRQNKLREQIIDWRGLTNYDEEPDADAWEEEMLEEQTSWEVAFSKGEQMARDEPFIKEEDWEDEY